MSPPAASPKTDINALLAKLDDAAQAELFTALSYKRQQADRNGPTRLQQSYWDALGEAIGFLPGRRPPLNMFIQKFGRASYDSCVADLEAMIDASCGPVLRAPQRQAVRVQALRAVASYLERRDIPCTSKTVMNASKTMLADALDTAFPGYARARLLHRVAPMARAAAKAA